MEGIFASSMSQIGDLAQVVVVVEVVVVDVVVDVFVVVLVVVVVVVVVPVHGGTLFDLTEVPPRPGALSTWIR